jgi:hypothetical protein
LCEHGIREPETERGDILHYCRARDQLAGGVLLQTLDTAKFGQRFFRPRQQQHSTGVTTDGWTSGGQRWVYLNGLRLTGSP